MTTSLIRGMTMEEAECAVSEAAERLRADGDRDLGVWTETGRNAVLVGISRKGKAAATLLIPKAEYDGLKLLELLESELG